ncbi:unnamed protein product, partial [Linum tenue]
KYINPELPIPSVIRDNPSQSRSLLHLSCHRQKYLSCCSAPSPLRMETPLAIEEGEERPDGQAAAPPVAGEEGEGRPKRLTAAAPPHLLRKERGLLLCCCSGGSGPGSLRLWCRTNTHSISSAEGKKGTVLQVGLRGKSSSVRGWKGK